MDYKQVNTIIATEINENKSLISDGYHTFSELYQYRMLYNVALFNEWYKNNLYDCHKSYKHDDGELCFGGGYFIVCANLPTGQISNHYKNDYFDLFKIIETEKAKYEYDGHSPNDCLIRLKQLYDN